MIVLKGTKFPTISIGRKDRAYILKFAKVVIVGIRIDKNSKYIIRSFGNKCKVVLNGTNFLRIKLKFWNLVGGCRIETDWWFWKWVI